MVSLLLALVQCGEIHLILAEEMNETFHDVNICQIYKGNVLDIYVISGIFM